MDLIILVSTCAINIILGAIIVFRDFRSPSARLFGLMSVFVTIWIITNFATDNYYGSNVLINDIANRATFIAGFCAVMVAVWFTYFFPVKRTASSREPALISVTSLLLLVLIPTDYIAGTVSLQGSSLVFTNGAFNWLYILAIIAAVYLIIRNLVRSMKRASLRHRQQARLVIIAFCTTTLLALLFNVIIPLFEVNWSTTHFGPLSTLILVGIMAYAIVKHQLFDIRLAFVRTVAYALSLTTLILIYAVAAFAASRWLFEFTSSPAQTTLNIALALFLAFIFQPVKRFFDRITNHFFYRDNYSTSEFYAHLSRSLTSTTDLRGLLQRASNEIANTLKAEYGLFFVYDDNHYVMTGTTDSRHRLPIQDARIIDSYVEQYGDKVIVADLLADHDELRRLLVSHKVCLVLPLQRGGSEIIGYFLMGEHRSGGYARRDIRALETVADELVIAIQNALSVQEVKELNATLQQRIDEATKELRASNAQLQRLDEAKDEFVSMASHQLRTPLTSVKGYIDMVLEGDAGKISDMQKHLLGEAFTSSERMVHLINDFLNVSRLQTGKFMIDRRPVDLATIIRQEVDSLQTTAGQRQLKLTYKMPTGFPQLYIDEGKMRQVVMNFIDNAIYYSKEDTTITVTLAVDGDIATMTVKDTGIGVPQDEQAQLFTKFYRASNARKQRPDGTGVGLYLAKKVVVAHGGSMVFHSTPGKGSTFGFTLPIKKLALAPVSDTDDLNN